MSLTRVREVARPTRKLSYFGAQNAAQCSYQQIVTNDEYDRHHARLAILQGNDTKKPAHGERRLKKQRKLYGTLELGKILHITGALQ